MRYPDDSRVATRKAGAFEDDRPFTLEAVIDAWCADLLLPRTTGERRHAEVAALREGWQCRDEAAADEATAVEARGLAALGKDER